jgi:hypothetical protein
MTSASFLTHRRPGGACMASEVTTEAARIPRLARLTRTIVLALSAAPLLIMLGVATSHAAAARDTLAIRTLLGSPSSFT